MKIIRLADLELEAASHESEEAPGVMKKVILMKDDFIPGHVEMLNWALLPVGNAFRPHYHEDMQEIFFLTQGRARMIVDDEETVLGTGDAVVVPPGGIHLMENIGDDNVEYLVIGVSLGAGGKTRIV